MWVFINVLFFVLGIMFLREAVKLDKTGSIRSLKPLTIGLAILMVDVLSWFVWIVEGSI